MRDNEVFSLRLRQLQQKGVNGKKVTNAALSDYLGLSRQVVSQYVCGISRPSLTNLKRLADYFGVTVDYLLGAANNDTVTTTPIIPVSAAGIKMRDVIQKVSEEYRNKRGEVGELQDELREIKNELFEASRQWGENITLARYNKLVDRQTRLEDEIRLKQQFCEGMAYTRELLMDFGFDIEVVKED